MTKTTFGTAYAFFDCRASKKEILERIPAFREIARTPPLLELSLSDKPSLRVEILPKTVKAKVETKKYMMTAKLPDAQNNEAADELANIFSHVLQSSLYGNGEPAESVIAYKDGFTYLLW